MKIKNERNGTYDDFLNAILTFESTIDPQKRNTMPKIMIIQPRLLIRMWSIPAGLFGPRMERQPKAMSR